MRDHVVHPSWWEEIRERLTRNIDDISSDLPEVIDDEILAEEYWRDKLDELYSNRYALWQVKYSAGALLDELASEFRDILHNWIPVIPSGTVRAESARLASIARLVGYVGAFPHFWPDGSIASRVERASDMVGQWFVDGPGATSVDPHGAAQKDFAGRLWTLIGSGSRDPDRAQPELESFVDDWYAILMAFEPGIVDTAFLGNRCCLPAPVPEVVVWSSAAAGLVGAHHG